jgi:hypothetical protein
MAFKICCIEDDISLFGDTLNCFLFDHSLVTSFNVNRMEKGWIAFDLKYHRTLGR